MVLCLMLLKGDRLTPPIYAPVVLFSLKKMFSMSGHICFMKFIF
jgi:hypothetical protein